jgi:hypothetical protein
MSSSEKKNEFLALVVTIFLSSIIGTCLDAFFVHKKITVKIGSTNNVKAILTENVDEKGLAGKEYICL